MDFIHERRKKKQQQQQQPQPEEGIATVSANRSFSRPFCPSFGPRLTKRGRSK